ncbi:MAG TPA: amidohydrolase family protein, partial [Verrucomicrobiae bacterium]|nr:amidohydrolase family protein [Verrucomicrobiae bacterium]
MRLRSFGFVVALAFSSLAWAAGNAATERVLYNGKVFTGEPEHPYAEAVAIRGDKIVAVGSRQDVTNAVGVGAEAVDLKGYCLLPGLIDSHQHAIDGGLTLITADAGDDPVSFNDLMALAAKAKKSGSGMRGDILYITGLNISYWSKTDELNVRFSSGAYENQPVLLEGYDGHTGWANRVMLRRAGVTKEFLGHLSDTARRYYGYGRDFEPNGFLVDAGLDKVSALLPDYSPEQYLQAGRAAVQYNYQLGITSWLDPAATVADLQTYQRLAEHGELKVHVAAFPVVNPRSDPSDQLAMVEKLRQQFKDVPNLTVPGFKVFADGVVELPAQTAALSKPYRNTGTNGELLFDPARFAALVTAADKAGLIVHVHAIGDRAVNEVLNGF